MTQTSDLDRFYRARLEWEDKSRVLLALIDQLDAGITSASDRKVGLELEREKTKARSDFARHLADQTYIASDHRAVVPIWLVSGVPAKKYKQHAKSWMEQRGKSAWDGSAPVLRHTVRDALERHLPVPDGTFGLHVERTVDIRSPRAFSVNLLGKTYHVVAEATEKTNAEAKEERAQAKFFSGED